MRLQRTFTRGAPDHQVVGQQWWIPRQQATFEKDPNPNSNPMAQPRIQPIIQPRIQPDTQAQNSTQNSAQISARNSVHDASQNATQNSPSTQAQPPEANDCSGGDLPPMRAPYTGAYKGFCWNSQALFAAEVQNQSKKINYACKLLESHDFGTFSETHVTTGKEATTKFPAHLTSFWSAGTAAEAGVGIILTNSFLKKNQQNTKRRLERNYPRASC